MNIQKMVISKFNRIVYTNLSNLVLSLKLSVRRDVLVIADNIEIKPYLRVDCTFFTRSL